MDKYIKLRNKLHKERRIEKSCKNKKSFSTKEEAILKNQDVYKCRYCGNFHRTTQLLKLIRLVHAR